MVVESNQSLRHITLSLLRKRSEHNECMISTLEEIALHQEELQEIGPILGRTCGKTLKILLLQNNVISQMKDLKYFKALEYLNLALNNIRLVEGIENCEMLEKLDLTLNFIGIENLERSVETMEQCRRLKELYMMGNPCCPSTKGESSQGGWSGYRMYIIARLPQLHTLDGQEVLRSDRIKALQHLPLLTAELRQLSSIHITKPKSAPLSKDENQMTQHSPEVREKISSEMAQQKAEKERNERINEPKFRGETDLEQEQKESIERAREREERGDIKQCNQGNWKFSFTDDDPKILCLKIEIQKHLSTSLIDVDVHPTYISIVIKSKVLRLVLPIEVKSEESVAQRSMASGHLLVLMPKAGTGVGVLIPKGGKHDRGNNKKECKPSGDKLSIARSLVGRENVKQNIGLREVCSSRKGETFMCANKDEYNTNGSNNYSDAEDEPPPLL